MRKIDISHCNYLIRDSFSVEGLLASALFAAAVLWLFDCAMMVHLKQVPPGSLYLPSALLILLFPALLIGVLEWLVLRVSFACAKVSGCRDQKGFRLAAGIFIGIVLLTIIIPVSTTLFSGAGISKWRWAPYGPCAVSAALFILILFSVWLCLFFKERWGGGGKRRLIAERLSIAAILAVAILAVARADVYLYPELYQYLHFTVMLIIFIACQFFFGVVLSILAGFSPGRLVSLRVLCWPIVIIVLISQIFVFYFFLSDNCQRVFAWKLPYYHRKAVHLIRLVWDLDRDGYSPVLGGGDPCDLDPSVIPFLFSKMDATRSHPRSMMNKRNERLIEKITDLIRKTSRYNILLLSVDALRADRLDDEKLAGKFAPCMESLKDRSVYFSRCFSPSAYTVVSMGGVFFSRICPWLEQLPCLSLVERLREAGFTTVRVMNPVMKSGARINYLARGYDREIFVGRDRWVKEWSGILMDGDIREAVVREIERLRGKKFFMWTHFEDTHEWPYLSSSLFPGPMSAREKYDYILHRTDGEICRILKALEDNGIADQTVVVITADHGQGLGEHNIMTHTQYVYNALIHVPLAISVPGVEPRLVAQNATLLDICPTLLELAGLEAGPYAEGISLVPALVGGKIPENRPIISIESKQRAVIEGPWKLIVTPEAVAMEFFNIEEDPQEQHDLSEQESLRDIKERLWRELCRYWHISVRGPVN